MKSSKTAGDTDTKKSTKLELSKDTVRSLRVKSDVRTGIWLGNGGATTVRSARPTTQTQHC